MADKKKAADKETTKASKSKKTEAPRASVQAKPKSSEAQKTSAPKTKRAPLLVQTKLAKQGEHNKDWKLVDASNLPLGRLSSEIAMLLMGKRKPSYTPGVDTGDHVVVVNAEKVVLTGKKWEQKSYQHHTNYPGGLKTQTAKQVLDSHPERLVQLAVWRMLPKAKGHMTRHWFKKLKVYTGTDHPHKAQDPKPYKLPNLGTWEN